MKMVGNDVKIWRWTVYQIHQLRTMPGKANGNPGGMYQTDDGEQLAAIRELSSLVDGFSPISLPEMDAAALLNRMDTKFVLASEQLLEVLSAVQEGYRVLSVNEQRLNRYRTLYFDTPDFQLYRLHVTGRADLYKVRSREYMDSHLSFLEVKHKTRKDRTVKTRIRTEQPILWMNTGAEEWLDQVIPYDSRLLEPKLWNTFTRITLVDHNRSERVTVDVNLKFYTEDREVSLDGIAIVEVKRDGRNQESLFFQQMRLRRVQPQGFSKYCIGVSMLYEDVKKNTMKRKLLRLEKMSGGVHVG